jgi:hypothetical protein
MKQFTSTQVKNMQSHSLSKILKLHETVHFDAGKKVKAFVKIVQNKILKLHETVHFDAGKKYAKSFLKYSAIKCHNKILKLHETVYFDAGKK